MECQSRENKESLSLRLDTKEHKVDALAVSKMIQAIVAIVEDAKQQVSKNEQMLIKARPFAEGSFEIPLDLIILSAGACFSFDVHPTLDNIIELLKK